MGETNVLQQLMKEVVELEKKLEAEIRRGEKLKAKEKNCDQNLLCMLKETFTGLGLEDLKSFSEKLVEIKDKTT
ncbi:hypothetical protein EJB05_30457, partial [Eragrostis curvula]